MNELGEHLGSPFHGLLTGSLKKSIGKVIDSYFGPWLYVKSAWTDWTIILKISSRSSFNVMNECVKEDYE